MAVCVWAGGIQTYKPHHFPTDCSQNQSPQAHPAGDPQDNESQESRKSLLAIWFAVIAMAAYALSIGLIKVEITRVKEPQQDDEGETPDVSPFKFTDNKQDNGEEE